MFTFYLFLPNPLHVKMKRFGQLIKVKSNKLEDYKKLHANPWPCVLDKLMECNIRNYSIFLAPRNELFAYFEYVGEDFESDMRKLEKDPCTKKWWDETDPCQESLNPEDKQWWLNLEEVFHID